MLPLVVADVVVLVAVYVVIGAVAPHVPRRWLESEAGPLMVLPWEDERTYGRWGARWMSRRLPELGTAFGGKSKSKLPGTSDADLIAYVVEVRRAEWVHWLLIAATFLLYLFNPRWLATMFVVVAIAGNVPFLVILRNNRLRILAILDQRERRHLL